jgi:hypothetical protein
MEKGTLGLRFVGGYYGHEPSMSRGSQCLILYLAGNPTKHKMLY